MSDAGPPSRAPLKRELGVAAVTALVVGEVIAVRLMQRLTLFKLGALIVIAILALALGAGRWSNFVPFVGLTVAALFVFRRRHGSQTAYRTPGYPVTPMIFLVLVAVLLTLLAGQAPL